MREKERCLKGSVLTVEQANNCINMNRSARNNNEYNKPADALGCGK